MNEFNCASKLDFLQDKKPAWHRFDLKVKRLDNSRYSRKIRHVKSI